MSQVFKKKYKTLLCQHWQHTGMCNIGVRCVFAHGKSQIRNPDDPINIDQNILKKQKMFSYFPNTLNNSIPKNNAMKLANQYQLLINQTQKIKIDQNNPHQIFQYFTQITYKSFKNNGKTSNFNILTDPTILKNITIIKLKFIIQQLLKLQLNQIIKCKIKICNELIEANNTHSCAFLLNDTMEREEISRQLKELYERIIEKGNKLYIELVSKIENQIDLFQKQQFINRNKSILLQEQRY